MKPIFFKKIFGTFKKGNRKSHKPILFSPFRFWKIVLWISASLAIVALSFGAYLFYKISTDCYMRNSQTDQTSIEPINRKKLELILGRYNEKMRKFSEIEITKPQISDPSL